MASPDASGPKPNLAPGELELATRRDDGCLTIGVAGEVDLATVPSLEQALAEGAAEEPNAIVVDLTRCVFIDSSGLALLVRSARAGDSRRIVALASANGQVERALEISGIGAMLPVFGTVSEAIAAVLNGPTATQQSPDGG
jgi:anti-sigma B factor antagonist